MTRLQEFNFGFRCICNLAPKGPPDDPPVRFYKNAMQAYLYDLFLAGPVTLFKLLEEVGMPEHANGIRVVMEEPYVAGGKATTMRTVADYRGKFLSHPHFTHKPIHDRVRREYPEMKTPEGNRRYQELLGLTYDMVAKLHDAMLERFPEVREHNKP
jgi:hypothetical protein